METLSRFARSQSGLQEDFVHSFRKGLRRSLDVEPSTFSAPKLPNSLMSQVVRAGMAKSGTKENYVSTHHLQSQVDEALGVDKLRLENEALQKRLTQSREQIVALESDVYRLEGLLEIEEESDVAQVLRDIKWRQMGLLCDDVKERRKRSKVSMDGQALLTPPTQRRALDVQGRPRFLPDIQGNEQDSFDEEWELYTHAQEQLNFLQQTFNQNFAALSNQKAFVNQQHERMMGLLTDRTRNVSLERCSAGSQAESPRNVLQHPEDSADDSVQDEPSQDDSDSTTVPARSSSSRRVSFANHTVFAEDSDHDRDDVPQCLIPTSQTSHRPSEQAAGEEDMKSAFQTPDRRTDQSPGSPELCIHDSSSSIPSEFFRIGGPGITSARQYLDFSRDTTKLQALMQRRKSLSQQATLQSLPSIELRSDSPRDLSGGPASTKESELKPSLSAKSGSYTPWKWQIDGALSEAAQTLTKNRSLQMETERQRLWQAAGADPDSIKQRIKELDEKESALALKAMQLEAREHLILDQERLSDVALSRSIALDRREADLKARESHLTKNLSKQRAREEEVKILRKRIADLEHLIGLFSSPRNLRAPCTRTAWEKACMYRSKSTSVDASMLNAVALPQQTPL